MMNIKMKLADPRCAPLVGSRDAAGMDLRVFLSGRDDAAVVINPGETVMLETGCAVAIPAGWVGLIAPRSSTGKLRITLENTLGVIDSDYRGYIKARLYNFGKEPQILYNFDRIMQMVVVPHFNPNAVEIVDSLDETVRGDQGFGHSGQN